MPTQKQLVASFNIYDDHGFMATSELYRITYAQNGHKGTTYSVQYELFVNLGKKTILDFDNIYFYLIDFNANRKIKHPIHIQDKNIETPAYISLHRGKQVYKPKELNFTSQTGFSSEDKIHLREPYKVLNKNDRQKYWKNPSNYSFTVNQRMEIKINELDKKYYSLNVHFSTYTKK